MSRARVLVVDDDGGTREVLKTVLEKAGHAVELARDGEEGFRTALEWAPDLLLTDIMMPRVDGWTLVKRLRSRGEFALMPVIFLTKLTSEEDRIQGFRLGADDYIPKPFNYEELVARVARALERRDAMEEEVRRNLGPRASAPGAEDSEDPEDSEDELLMQGVLDSFGFSALLGVFEQEGATGLLEVDHPDGRQARVWIREGQVVQASIEGGEIATGAEAIYALLAWRSGHFTLHRTSVDDRNEVGMSSTHLLLEGARRLDEDEVDRPD